ncbi:MAG: response regulator [Planctomycetota bacterium]
MLDAEKSVLVVDDDPMVTAGTSMRLRANGYQTRLAQDGVAALEAIADEVPDLIVMDVRMARLDGIATLRKLRVDESTSEVPVVILSASMQDEETALDAGASYFVKKPYRGTDLLEAAESALRAPR